MKVISDKSLIHYILWSIKHHILYRKPGAGQQKFKLSLVF